VLRVFTSLFLRRLFFGTQTSFAPTLERPKFDRGQASDRRAAHQLKFQRSMLLENLSEGSKTPTLQEQPTMRTRILPSLAQSSRTARGSRFRDSVALAGACTLFHDAQVFERGPRIGPKFNGARRRRY